jgi:hypothetical protein
MIPHPFLTATFSGLTAGTAADIRHTGIPLPDCWIVKVETLYTPKPDAGNVA